MTKNDLFQNFDFYVFTEIATNGKGVSVDLDTVAFNGFYFVQGDSVGFVDSHESIRGQFFRLGSQWFVGNIGFVRSDHLDVFFHSFDEKNFVNVDFHHFFVHFDEDVGIRPNGFGLDVVF